MIKEETMTETEIEATISSELYDEATCTKNDSLHLNPTLHINNSVTRFVFKLPTIIKSLKTTLDNDGDLIVQRPQRDRMAFIDIEYAKRTTLKLVGLQIWRASFLLADWLLYNHESLGICSDSAILELGSGVGLTAIVASMFQTVYATDLNRDNILQLIRANCNRNKHIIKYCIDVFELDFASPFIPRKCFEATTIIAADVIYDNDITDAFVSTISQLLSQPPAKTVIISLEKRYVFTIEDCDTVAPCYEYFLQALNALKVDNIKIVEIPIDFPQYFHYKRTRELTLWTIYSR